jgi:RNA polymerase sigma-70 factor, ECF subfamily
MEACVVTEQGRASDSSDQVTGGVGRSRRRASSETAEELGRLFEDHADSLVRTLFVAGYPDASDAVQEAFVQAMVHWRRIRRYDDPLAWLRRVAINRARDRRRSRRRQAALTERLEHATPTASVAESHRGVDDDVVAAVAALPPQQREVVALFYYADLPIVQIADAMGINEGTVKSHLHAARAAVARKLEVTP